MFCSSCGASLPEDMKFCTACGAPVTARPNVEINDQQNKQNKPASTQANQPLVGYSDRINDPAFAKYLRNTTAWSFIFAGILSVIVIVSFYIYGERSYEMDNPQALFIGLGIAGMFLSIALITTLFRTFDKTYDAVVMDKKKERKRKKEKTGEDDYYIRKYTLYTVIFKSDKGKIIKKYWEDNSTQYDYFNIGDRVRHHKGLATWEKYDKSQDTIIFCNACSTMHKITDDVCSRCYCPLLK